MSRPMPGTGWPAMSSMRRGALDGNGSTGQWVADQQTSMRRSAVALARRLDRHPQVAERVDRVVALRPNEALVVELDR